MNKVLLALTIVISSLGLASVDGVITKHEKNDSKKKNNSTLVCKTRNNTTKVGEVGSVTIKSDDSENVEINVEVVTSKITKNELRYESMKTDLTLADLPEGFVKNRMISFKRVAPNMPISTDSHFVYIKKSFPASIKITTVNKETGLMKVLPKCYVSDKFLTKIIKL